MMAPGFVGVAALALTLAALVASALVALKSLGRAGLQDLAEQSEAQGHLAQWALDHWAQLALASAMAQALLNAAAVLALGMMGWRLLGPWGAVGGWALAAALVVMAGTVIPRLLLNKVDDAVALALPFLRGWAWLLTPLTALLMALAPASLELEGPSVTRQEIQRLLEDEQGSGDLEETERKMIRSVILFEETRVSEIMVPRRDMDMLELSASMEEVIAELQRHGHSRIPVYQDNADAIVGVLYVKDLLPHLARQASPSLSKLLREPLFVPDSMRISDLFKTMQTRQIHMAIAVDEYGGTAGIITLEDLLEEIVGEIQDEYDQEEPEVERLSDHCWRIQAGLPLEDVNEATGSDFHSEEVDSLGGYLLDLFGNFPQQGDRIQDGPWTFLVSGVGDHRITEVVLRRNQEEAP